MLSSINVKKQTESKLQLMENRILNLKREESKARWKIDEIIRKAEHFQNIRKRKFETDMYKQEKFRELEEQKAYNQKKITLMRRQIMSNIANQRDNVYSLNRKAKEEVSESIRQLKDEKRKQTESERFRQKLNKHTMVLEHHNSKLNQSLDMFSKRSFALKNYEDKIYNNFEQSKLNTERIKELEMIEQSLIDKLKETYLEQDRIMLEKSPSISNCNGRKSSDKHFK